MHLTTLQGPHRLMDKWTLAAFDKQDLTLLAARSLMETASMAGKSWQPSFEPNAKPKDFQAMQQLRLGKPEPSNALKHKCRKAQYLGSVLTNNQPAVTDCHWEDLNPGEVLSLV